MQKKKTFHIKTKQIRDFIPTFHYINLNFIDANIFFVRKEICSEYEAR